MKKKINKKDENIDDLFDKLIIEKDKGIKHIEKLKQKITKKLDIEINNLYKKRNLIAEVFTKKKELAKKKLSVWKKIRKTPKVMLLRYFISMPFIYMMMIPAIILHILLEIYHQICFRLYDIPRVNPKEYFAFDRRHLPYLNWFEKLNCAYCSYFNALMAYAKEVAGRTERYWCPIKHAMRLEHPHSQYSNFVDYADGKALREEWDNLREFEEMRD